MSNTPEAVPMGEDGATDAPSQAGAHHAHAAALAKLGQTDAALREVAAAFERGDHSAELCMLGAEICQAREELETALEWSDRALANRSPSPAVLTQREAIVSAMHLLWGLHEHMELTVELCPEWWEARERLIRACMAARLYSVADAHIEIWLAHNSPRLPLCIDKAIACLETGRTAEAVRALEQALTLEPGINERLHITGLFVRAGALDHALQAARHTQQLAPDVPEVRLQCARLALWQGQSRDAATACRDLPESTPGLARLRAAIAFVEGGWEEALALTARALEQVPTDAEAHIVRAAALLRLKRYDEALQSVQTASETAAEWLPIVPLIDMAARWARSPTLPVHRFTELFASLGPVLPPVRVRPGYRGAVASKPVLDAINVAIHRLSGNFTSTLTFMPEGSRQWSSLSPQLPARLACAHVFSLLRARPWRWVIEQLRLLALQYPRSPFVHTHMAEVWLWYGDFAACEAECRRALAISRTETRWAWVGLGAALMMQERYRAALKIFVKCVRLWEPHVTLPMRVRRLLHPASRPRDADEPGAPLRAYRGETLRRCGQLDAAREDLTQCLNLVPTRVSAWINLGLIAFAQGRDDEVIDIYTRLHATLPELVRDIERDMPAGDRSGADGPRAMAAMFEHTLRAMRGNRSSHWITYFLKDGRARTLPGLRLTPL